jgi:hypothetical protein
MLVESIKLVSLTIIDTMGHLGTLGDEGKLAEPLGVRGPLLEQSLGMYHACHTSTTHQMALDSSLALIPCITSVVWKVPHVKLLYL